MRDWIENFTLDHDDMVTPLYQQIAREIRRGVDCGAWRAGQRLPTQRALARRLGVNIATVTRAYGLLEQQGLVAATPGRGTFVQTAGDGPFQPDTGRPASTEFVDLTINRAATGLYCEELGRLLPKLPRNDDFYQLRDYLPGEGSARARRAGGAWMSHGGWEVDAAQVAVTSGAQHGLLAAAAAVLKPGDVILTGELTYYGLRSLALMLNLELKTVAGDADGLMPDAVERACEDPHARALFVVPTMHNPTTLTLSEERRRALAAVARRKRLFLFEDDVYGPLQPDRPLPVSAHYTEGSFYITGTSKSIAPGLRVGFVAAPAVHLNALSDSLRAISWMAAPLGAAIMAQWVEDGTSERLIAAQRDALSRRLWLARRTLSGLRFRGQPGCPHIWLPLPPPWRAQEFADLAESRGLGVLPAEAFMVGRSGAPHAIRVNLGAALSDQQLVDGLETLTSLLHSRTGQR